MLMRFWQVLVMAALSMIAGCVLLGNEIPLRTDNLPNTASDLLLLAGYVNAATWMVAGALVAIVWAVRSVALTRWLPRLQYYSREAWGSDRDPPWQSRPGPVEAGMTARLSAYVQFWNRSHHSNDHGRYSYESVPWDGWMAAPCASG